MNKREKELQLAAPGILSRVMNDVVSKVEGFGTVSQGKYFLKKISLEQEGEQAPSLSISLIYLQEQESFRETLDEEVMGAVRESLANHKLTGAVRDVVVNLIHFREEVRKG